MVTNAGFSFKTNEIGRANDPLHTEEGPLPFKGTDGSLKSIVQSYA